MRLKTRARDAWRPAIWGLVALLALLMAPAAAAERRRPAPRAVREAPACRPDGPPGRSRSAPDFAPDASERVGEVQRKLNRLGHGAGAADGLFGPITDAAVRRFQADSGLVVDGAVGPRTLGQLRSRIRQKERLLARGSGFKSSGGSERVREVQRKPQPAWPRRGRG